jgi:hypothetical protein
MSAVKDVHQDHDNVRPSADLVEGEGSSLNPHVTVTQRIPVTAARGGLRLAPCCGGSGLRRGR